MIITDKIKQAMFNGRVNSGKFRRGMWSVEELNKAQIDGKPIIPGDAVKLYYSDGCIAFYINDKKQIVTNNKNKKSDVTKAIIDLFKNTNPDVQIIKSDDLDGASRSGGASRDWDAVFQM